MRQDFYRSGEAAVALLLREDGAESEESLVTATLSVRASTGPPRAS